jgi:hypothetical protein
MSLRLRDGRTISWRSDYEGFTNNPAVWETVFEIQALTEPHTTSSMRERIAEAVGNSNDRNPQAHRSSQNHTGRSLGRKDTLYGL